MGTWVGDGSRRGVSEGVCTGGSVAATGIASFAARPTKLHMACIETRDGLHDEILLCIGEFRINRQRKDFLAGFLSDGQLAGAIAERRKCLLQVKAKRVIDFGRDAGDAERFLELVAASRANGELIVNVMIVCRRN